MILKLEDYRSIMNFNFVFISYSVIYAKYSYCYEVPKDQPQRYFDGKEWRIVKPRPSIRPKVPRHSSLTVDVDWGSFKKTKATELNKTATQMPTCDTTKKATAKETNRVKLKLKNTTKRKFSTTENYALKLFLMTLRRATLSSTTPRTLLPHCPPVCKLKLKSTTDTANSRVLPLKKITHGDWRDNWTYLRPIGELSPVTLKKLTPKVTTSGCIPTIKMKLLHETTTRNIAKSTNSPMITTKNPMKVLMKGPVTTTWKPTRPFRNPLITTRTSAASIIRPMSTTKAPLTKTETCPKFSGKSEDVANSTGNWSNLLKEFLKYVEEKKCERSPSQYKTATTTMFKSGYVRADNRKIIDEDDDLMNILMDGVEIDNKISKEGDAASRSKEQLKNEGQKLNDESVEGLVSQMNNDYHNQGLESLNPSIIKRRDTGQFPEKMKYFKEFQAKNSKNDFTSSHNRESEIYFDEFKDKNENEDDQILEDFDFNSYPEALEPDYAKKGYARSQSRRSEVYIDKIKYQDVKKDDGLFHDIKTKAYLDDSKDSKAIKDDTFLQDSNIEFYSDELKDKNIKKDYITSQIRGTEVYSDEYKYTQKEDEVIGDSDLKYYINELEDKHAIKESDPESSDSYLDPENIRPQDKNHYLQDESTETFNSKELNEINDYTEPKSMYPIGPRRQINNELFQDSDITFDLEDENEKAAKYAKNSIEVQRGDSEYANTIDDLNELK